MGVLSREKHPSQQLRSNRRWAHFRGWAYFERLRYYSSFTDSKLRKEDGSEHKPDGLHIMLASLDRHFQEKGLTIINVIRQSFWSKQTNTERKDINWLLQGWTWEEEEQSWCIYRERNTVEYRSLRRREPNESQPHCSMCSANSLRWGVVSTSRCEIKISSPETGETEYREWTKGWQTRRLGEAG